MYVPPLAVLSYSLGITNREDTVIVSRFALESLLRSAFPGFSADDFDAASYLGPYSDRAPVVDDDQAWRDALTYMVPFGLEGGCQSENSGVDFEWFGDIAQAIDNGAVSEVSLSLAENRC